MIGWERIQGGKANLKRWVLSFERNVETDNELRVSGGREFQSLGAMTEKALLPNKIIIIIMNFYSPVSNTRCHSIGHKMRIARIKFRVDSPGRWERA